jgi:hypothetical protein
MRMRPSFATPSTYTLSVRITLNHKINIEPESVGPYMQGITMTCMKVLVDERCDEIPEPFKKEVGKFIKSVIMSTQLPLLQQIES